VTMSLSFMRVAGLKGVSRTRLRLQAICVLAFWTESAWLLLPVVPERKDCLSKLGDPGDIGGFDVVEIDLIRFHARLLSIGG